MYIVTWKFIKTVRFPQKSNNIKPENKKWFILVYYTIKSVLAIYRGNSAFKVLSLGEICCCEKYNIIYFPIDISWHSALCSHSLQLYLLIWLLKPCKWHLLPRDGSRMFICDLVPLKTSVHSSWWWAVNFPARKVSCVFLFLWLFIHCSFVTLFHYRHVFNCLQYLMTGC